jgi:hypothetical protein
VTPAVLKLAACVAALGLAFAAGRFTAAQPEEHTSDAIVHTQTVWQRTVYRREATVRIVRVKTPDGTVREEETSHSVETAGTETATASEGVRLTTRDVVPTLPAWRVGALVGASLPLALEVGLHAERRIAGPLHGGAWVLVRPPIAGAELRVAAGLSLSVEF